MQRSSIQWTEQTWNPTRGCTEVGPGCDHCYARTFAERFRGTPGHAYEQGFDLRLAPHKLEEPLHINTSRMIFVNSMSDLFHCKIPTEYIKEAANVMLTANWHIYQVLTKRSKRMNNLLNSKDPVFREVAQAEHIWWGVSAENKKHGHPRIKHLQETEARTRWISFEPLLEDIMPCNLDGIAWAVVGGESGPGAREIKETWVKRLLHACSSQDIPFFFKQWGGTRKHETGRTFNNRTYDDMPEILHAKVPERSVRQQAIEIINKRAREQWADHELSVLDPRSEEGEKAKQTQQTLFAE